MSLLAGTAACVETPRAGASSPTADVDRNCSQADALQRGCTPPEDGAFEPTPDVAGKDYRGNGNKEGCWTDLNFKRFKSCSFGSKKAKYTVALVGNSHMAQYLKSFTGWTGKRDLRIVTFLIPQCFATEAKIDFSGRKDAKGLSERCYEWGQWARREAAALDPDLIVTSERTYREPVEELPAGKNATWRKGYRDYLKAWVDGGHRVLVIRDNPVPEFDVPACLERNPRKFSACGGDRDAWVPPDPVVQAAQSLDSDLVEVLDMTGYMCDDSRCPAVLAGISVYRDHSHLSGTWIAALEPYLKRPFMKILKR
ncbi:MAG: SGNH hydrolase domain-containing protein [Sporichthyaceae bacterium]